MRVALTIAFFLLAIVPCSFAQNDAGNPDTIDMVYSVLPDFTTNQLQVQMDLYVYNDANTLIGSSMGFSWSNPNLQMDSATSSAFTTTHFDLGRFFYEDNDIVLTNTNQRFIFGSATLFDVGLPPLPTRQLWGSYYFTLSSWDACDSLTLDTLLFSPSSAWSLIAVGNQSYQPQWPGRKVVRDTACAISANLVLSQDSLYFQGVVGGPTPPGQTFNVISDTSPISFTLTESIPWMVVSPTLGITTQVINVLPNTVGLSAGLYIDSIRIESAEASNSPVYAKVVLQLDPPPAQILAAPSQLFFNAVAGGANPASKILTITNGGGLPLNWSVSNSESWLSLTPSSGADSGDVAVSVDITGLAFADYEDTIWIADPSASNSPKGVPVFLTVGSDLPIIVADSAFNFVVVPTGVSVDPGKVTISNGGAGTMTFWTEENSTRLFTITPDAGTAPQELTIEYKLTSGSAGDNYFDTLWIFSNEAINSPLPVVFQFHLVDNPALMVISNDTASLTLFECDQGIDAILPSTEFQVSNAGGDDPMPFTVVHESDLYTLTVTNPVAPAIVRLFSNFLDLPVGIYLDTIEIIAPNSISSPDTVIVKYEVMPGTHAPAISLSSIFVTIPSQENAGPIVPTAFDIKNIWGGCMDWTIEEDIVWLNPTDTSGTAPTGLGLGADATGFLFGQYQDSFFVHAPGAAITPRKVDVLLKVWRFHGDTDYSGFIDVNDLTYFVRYLFQSGEAPQPEFFVGNLDCNHTVDVNDLTYLVDYLFRQGPVPCGNPYK